MNYSLFLSYRRNDSPGYVARLSDDFSAQFGAEVFRDVDAIAGGADWRTVLEQQVSNAKVVLAIIGPRWAEELTQRNDADNDFVRIELNLARQYKVPVIPVCINDTKLPEPEALGDLAWLHDVHVYQLSDTQKRWQHDQEMLAGRVAELSGLDYVPRRNRIERLRERPRILSMVAGALLMAAIGITLAAWDTGRQYVTDLIPGNSTNCPPSDIEEIDAHAVLISCGIDAGRIRNTVELMIANAAVPKREMRFFASRFGLPVAAVETIFKLVVEELGSDDLDKAFDKFAQFLSSHLRLVDDQIKISTDNEDIDSAVDSANLCLSIGDYLCADRELAKTIESNENLWESEPLIYAAIQFERGTIDLARFKYSDAADHFGDAASRLPKSENNLRFVYQMAQAKAFRTQGEEQANKVASQRAIELYREIVDSIDQTANLQQWADATNSLGTALTLDKQHAAAVETFKSILGVVDAVDHREIYATTENSLGKTLRILGSRNGETETLEKSVVSFKSSLALTDKNESPMSWADIQNNLGVTLRVIGASTCNNSKLEESLGAFESALAIRKKKIRPILWARTQRNIGASQRVLGTRLIDSEYLKESIEAFENATTVMQYERSPVDWVSTTNNHSNSLRLLARQEISGESFEKALDDLETILNLMGTKLEQNNKRLLNGILRNKAVTLLSLAKRNQDPELLQDALEVATDLVQQTDKNKFRRPWFANKITLGAIYMQLGDRDADVAMLREALGHFEAALDEWNRHRFEQSLDWSAAKTSIGKALTLIGLLENDQQALTQARQHLEEGLGVRKKACAPAHWADSQHSLGIIYRASGELTTFTDLLSKSVTALKSALSVRTETNLPLQWAGSMSELARSLHLLGTQTSNHDLLEEAMETIESADSFYAKHDIKPDDSTFNELKGEIKTSLAAIEN